MFRCSSCSASSRVELIVSNTLTFRRYRLSINYSPASWFVIQLISITVIRISATSGGEAHVTRASEAITGCVRWTRTYAVM